MRELALSLFVIGAVPFATGIVYYLVDGHRTGVLFRKKLPWFPIIAAGWALGATGVIIGMVSSGQLGPR
ncbi:hypothetical protein HP467_15890 [Curtobacterium albidum]|uniref:Uncharacterized protein n=1 Tax=Curtobacterium citreum TaxID=2036 RepID=A0A850E1Q7_9MICO|nr:hypothetical protein [Curtobacterium albidum]NUU29573.1 hypothetical protein [Curtobacterium albidum]